MSVTRPADVIVIGCGPAGAAYAVAAARAGARVLLVGRPQRYRFPTLELVSGRACEALANLGCYDTVAHRAPRCAGTVTRWGDEAVRDHPALLDPDGAGLIVDRAWFDPLLLEHAVAAGVQRVCAAVHAIGRQRNMWDVTTATARHAGGKLVLATGRSSHLPESVGARRRSRLRALALTAFVPQPLPELGQRLFIESVAEGWWYGLGREDGVGLGYCCDRDRLRPGLDPVAAAWAEAAAFLQWPPALSVRPWLRPATCSGPIEAVPPDAQIIGDAALALDPLSGHGLTVALEGALRAANDPGGYRSWLSDVAAAHADVAGPLYREAKRRHAGGYWSKRCDGAFAGGASA